MNFLITNIFVGVVVSAYNREKENLGQFFLMDKNQKEWFHTKLLVVRSKPKYYLGKPKQTCRRPFYKVSKSKYFEYIILILIGLNIVAMGMVWNE